jgi:MFS family permease
MLMPALSSIEPLRRSPEFRKLWVGQTLSSIGDPILPFALAFLVLGRGDGAVGVAAVFAARAVATSLAVLAGGVLADRLSRKRVMIWADAFRVTTILAIVVLNDHLSLVSLSLLVFVFGLGGAVFRPAHLALIPSLVTEDQTQAANALTSLSARTAGLFGPALAGALVALTSVRWALLVDALTFTASLFTLSVLREPSLQRNSEGPPSFGREVLEGFAIVGARRWIVIEIVAGAVQVTLCLGPWLVLLPVVAADSPFAQGQYAALLIAMGAGAMAGTVVGGRVRSSRPGVVAGLAMMPFSLALVGLAADWSVPVLVVLHVLAGVGTEVFLVLWVTALQRDVPSHALGRVFALDQLGSLGLLPIGMLAAGLVVEYSGTSSLLATAAVINAAMAVLPLLSADVRRFSSRSSQQVEERLSCTPAARPSGAPSSRPPARIIPPWSA